MSAPKFYIIFEGYPKKKRPPRYHILTAYYIGTLGTELEVFFRKEKAPGEVTDALSEVNIIVPRILYHTEKESQVYITLF